MNSRPVEAAVLRRQSHSIITNLQSTHGSKITANLHVSPQSHSTATRNEFLQMLPLCVERALSRSVKVTGSHAIRRG
jgi:hypothetical protein